LVCNPWRVLLNKFVHVLILNNHGLKSVLQNQTMTSIEPYNGTFSKAELRHLLRRTLFGVKQSDMDFFANKTLTEVVDTLLTTSVAATTPAPPLKNYYDPNNNFDPEIAAGQTWVYTQDNALANARRKASLKAWWVGLILKQERSILEKMVLFWHNHFPIDVDDKSVIMGYIYGRTLRFNALGNFKNLVKLITLDPMMLRYLNGAASNLIAPDENYARELQELFTVGKGENAKYTEGDVRAAARLLTGYQITIQSAGFPFQTIFVPSRHDTGDKQFSAFYNNTLIRGRSGTEGSKELDDLLTMIFAQNEVALFMCRKLYRFFVYHKIDATVEQNVILPLAELFRQSNYDILPVLKALLTSAPFFDAAFRGCMIKSPVDLVVGMGRSFNIVLPEIQPNDFPSIQVTYNAWSVFHVIETNGSAAQRQALIDPPNVAGWPAYYQEPNYYRLWIDAETYPKRLKFAETLVNGVGVSGVFVNALDWTKTLSTPQNVTQLIDDALESLYAVAISPTFKARLKGILLSGQTNDSYWTTAWNEFIANPTAVNRSVVETRLLAFYRAIVIRPEFNLM
jgi:uncharacterized protein (DUF1800 family)